MKKEELLIVYGYCQAIWSTFKVPTGDSAESQVEAKLFDATWFETLAPYDLNIVLLAVKEYAKTSDFCNIAKVGEMCRKIKSIADGSYINEEDVLKEIRLAISRCAKDEAFAKLSPFAKEVVGGAWQLYKWGSLESGQVDTVVMSNLRKRVKGLLQKQKDENIALELEAINHFSDNILEMRTNHFLEAQNG